MTVFERLHRPFERLQMPPLDGATEWLNSEPLGPAERQSLAGWGPSGRWFKSSRPDLLAESAKAEQLATPARRPSSAALVD